MKLTHKGHLIILPTLLVSLVSCTTGNEFTTRVLGKVVNRYTEEPIEGAFVYLKDGVGASGELYY